MAVMMVVAVLVLLVVAVAMAASSSSIRRPTMATGAAGRQCAGGMSEQILLLQLFELLLSGYESRRADNLEGGWLASQRLDAALEFV